MQGGLLSSPAAGTLVFANELTPQDRVPAVELHADEHTFKHNTSTAFVAATEAWNQSARGLQNCASFSKHHGKTRRDVRRTPASNTVGVIRTVSDTKKVTDLFILVKMPHSYRASRSTNAATLGECHGFQR